MSLRARRAAQIALLAAGVGPICASGVPAAGVDRLAQFLASTHSAKAEFAQRIVDRNGKVVQDARGAFVFSRGRFRWTYSQPYPQVIVGDGARVWIYDADLKQVTVRRMDRALTSTPAALIAGDAGAMKAFTFSEQGTRDGLEWIDALPREREGGFERVRIGFGFAGPQVMEFFDGFGQVTTLRFTSFERNAAVDAAQLRFSPPPGVDVIGEPR